jgi:hypothetical protein
MSFYLTSGGFMLKKLFAAVIAVGLLHTLAFAQGITPTLAKGTTALLFSFNGLSNLNAGDFDGGVGVKYYYLNFAPKNSF